jgi:hypothetical protein
MIKEEEREACVRLREKSTIKTISPKRRKLKTEAAMR